MLNGIGALAAFSIALRQGDALRERFVARADNQNAIARFREQAASISDTEALLKDRRTLEFVLEAFQLESEINKTAILRRILTEPPGEATSLANKLTDQRWRQLAAAFGGREGKPLGNAALVNRIAALAMENRFEKAMGEGNAGVREALYFRRMAGNITTVPQLMSDRALTTVARGALGLPEQFSLLSYEQQRDLLTDRIDLEELRDPKVVERMAQRYLVLAAPQTQSADPLLALFGGGSVETILSLSISA